MKRNVDVGAVAHGFDLSKRFEKLTRREQNLILYGNPPMQSRFAGNGQNGNEAAQPSQTRDRKKVPGLRFPGVFGFLEENLAETNSDGCREWLTQYMSAVTCAVCGGRRLRAESLAVKVGDLSISDFTALALSDARPTVDRVRHGFTLRQRKVAGRPLAEIAERLDFLLAVGRGYLSLDRSAATLSGGEAQRIRLATQIGSRVRGVVYALSEASIGLHAGEDHPFIASRAHR